MNPTEALELAGIRPTPNRILVLRSLMESVSPLSMTDLEQMLDPMEKSSIFRVLNTLLEHDMVHAIEDGRGIAMYEICHSDHHGEDNDMHAHFYCENCHRVFCLESVPAHIPPVPDGFSVKAVNYMLKGICRDCQSAAPKGSRK